MKYAERFVSPLVGIRQVILCYESDMNQLRENLSQILRTRFEQKYEDGCVYQIDFFLRENLSQILLWRPNG
jgi:hypothetical protein